MSDFPCEQIGALSGDLEVSLPMGISLKGFADFSQGAPSDCTAMFSLLGQVTPMLGSLDPLLKILNVMSSLLEFMKAMTSGIPEAISKAGAVVDALSELIPLFAATSPIQVGLTIKGVLNLVITFLDCFITEISQILEAEARINESMRLAADNPTLAFSLSCASANLEVSRNNMMAALGPIQPIFAMLTTLESFVGVELGLPDITSIAQSPDAGQAIQDVQQAIQTIRQAINLLPG